jgi:hypothetical protein
MWLTKGADNITCLMLSPSQKIFAALLVFLNIGQDLEHE